MPAGLDEKRQPLPVLTQEQQSACREICEEWAGENCPSPVLLHGITGSGKTVVYMQLIARTLAEGKQAILLVPEIALTYQNVQRFYSWFGEQVAIVHSRLSVGERMAQFERVRNGQSSLMIGPRSALFAPFSRLGLIIVDEEQETSYHSEMTPRYHARETASGESQDRTCPCAVRIGHTVSGSICMRCECGSYHRVVLNSRYGP